MREARLRRIGCTASERRLARLGLLCAALLALAGTGPQPVAAQGHVPVHPEVSGGTSPALPTGPATIRGQVLHAGDPTAGAGIPISIYALKPDGSPGMGGTQSDPNGRFVFEGLSNEPGVVYLLGMQYQGVPFGHRVVFEPGQTEVDVELKVAEFSTDASGLEVVESVITLDRLGRHLLVRESHLIRNPGESVIHVKAESRGGRAPVFRATLPAGASGFADGQSGGAGKLVREGDDVQFWGPAYPGDQKVSYQYLLTLSEAEGPAKLDVVERFPSGTGRVVVLSAADGPTVGGPALDDRGETEEVGGRRYRRLTAGAVAPGGELALAIEVPESTGDPKALSIRQANFWVHMDDTSMEVTGEWDLHVESPVQLLAAPGEPLLRIELPADSELLGIAPMTQRMGLVPADGGRALELMGPLAPGKSTLSYRFRSPVRAGEARLELAFNSRIATFNLLMADIGVVIESERLHRRRPFRSGARIYLHRQAYQVDPGEIIAMGFERLDGEKMPRSAAVTGILLMAGLGAWFLMAPLRTGVAAAASDRESVSDLMQEREHIYDSIRDLEHDFETGKLDAGDYDRMKGELRASAVELLRQEQQAHEEARAAPPTAASGRDAASGGGFCPSCGGRVTPESRFCSHCGGPITPIPNAGSGE